MESASIDRLIHRHDGKSVCCPEGFSLLEMMMVITVILIIASISAPIYMTAVVRAREAVLRDDLFILRSLINRFTLDNRRSPAGLEELVEGGYLGESLPTPSQDQTKPGKSSRKTRPSHRAIEAGDCGRSQRLQPRLTRRHPLQQLLTRTCFARSAASPRESTSPRSLSRCMRPREDIMLMMQS